MYNKFIIENDCLIFSIVKYHKQLANDIRLVQEFFKLKIDVYNLIENNLAYDYKNINNKLI